MARQAILQTRTTASPVHRQQWTLGPGNGP